MIGVLVCWGVGRLGGWETGIYKTFKANLLLHRGHSHGDPGIQLSEKVKVNLVFSCV